MKVITSIISKCDPPTKDHQRRVSLLAVQIGRQLSLSSGQIDDIRVISLVHDIGKVILPTEFMVKTTDLNPDERKIVRNHPQVGFDMLNGTGFSDTIKQAVLQHHEHIDGSGYPNNLTGGQILTEAKIVTVADVVDAITSNRPYNPQLDIEDALIELSDHKGTYYDPNIVEACERIFRDAVQFGKFTAVECFLGQQPARC